MDEDTNVDDTQTTGVPAAEQTVDRPLTKREQQMAAIKVRRETDDDGGGQQPSQDQQQQQTDPALDEQIDAQLNDEPVLIEDPSRARVRIKVDGEETEVSVAEAIRNYQKQVAADRRLAEANRILAEAKARPLPPVVVDDKGGGTETDAQPDPNGDGKVSAKEFIASLFEGDEEKAAAALEKVLGAGRTNNNGPTLDPEQLAAQLTPQIRQQLKDESALEQFTASNADLAEDPYLTDLTNRFIEEEMDGGKPYHEALDSGAKRTREWMASRGMGSKANPNPTTTRSSKLERKAQIDNVNALNKTASTTVEPPQSASDVIAQMRAARGMG